MECHYCSKEAIGINYRPRADLDNAPTCLEHSSALFIPYKGQISNDGPQILNEIFDIVIGQYNLIKSELKSCQKSMAQLKQTQTYGFELNFNPYIILNKDKGLLLDLLLRRIKTTFTHRQRNKMSFNSPRRSRISSYGQWLNDESRLKHARSPVHLKKSQITLGSISEKREQKFKHAQKQKEI